MTLCLRSQLVKAHHGTEILLNVFVLQDYGVKAVDEENAALPNVKSLSKSAGFHQTPEFPDDPFPAPDWVLFPPPEFYKVDTSNGFQSSSASGVWDEETDIFQPFKETAHSSSANQNTESRSSANQRDPLLDFILSRQEKFQATPSPASSSDPANVIQETSTETNGFFKTPSLSTSSPFVSNSSPASDDIFKTSSSTAGAKVSDIEAFDPLFDPQNKVQSRQKSSDLLFTPRQDTKHHFGISHDALHNQETTPSTNEDLVRMSF